eukprot:PhF_6_TR5511/c0_g1_i1/m.7819
MIRVYTISLRDQPDLIVPEELITRAAMFRIVLTTAIFPHCITFVVSKTEYRTCTHIRRILMKKAFAGQDCYLSDELRILLNGRDSFVQLQDDDMTQNEFQQCLAEWLEMTKRGRRWNIDHDIAPTSDIVGLMVRSSPMECCEECCENGSCLSCISSRGCGGMCKRRLGYEEVPLIQAAGEGVLVWVNALVSGGADVNEVDRCVEERGESRFEWDVETPLTAAVRGGHVDIVKVLVQNGANVDKQVCSEPYVYENSMQIANKCFQGGKRTHLLQALQEKVLPAHLRLYHPHSNDPAIKQEDLQEEEGADCINEDIATREEMKEFLRVRGEPVSGTRSVLQERCRRYKETAKRLWHKEELEELHMQELRVILRSAGHILTGNKPTLIDRILSNRIMKKKLSSQQNGEEVVKLSRVPLENLSSMTREEIEDYMKPRQLNVKGPKAVLIERLIEAVKNEGVEAQPHQQQQQQQPEVVNHVVNHNPSNSPGTTLKGNGIAFLVAMTDDEVTKATTTQLQQLLRHHFLSCEGLSREELEERVRQVSSGHVQSLARTCIRCQGRFRIESGEDQYCKTCWRQVAEPRACGQCGNRFLPIRPESWMCEVCCVNQNNRPQRGGAYKRGYPV